MYVQQRLVERYIHSSRPIPCCGQASFVSELTVVEIGNAGIVFLTFSQLTLLQQEQELTSKADSGRQQTRVKNEMDGTISFNRMLKSLAQLEAPLIHLRSCKDGPFLILSWTDGSYSQSQSRFLQRGLMQCRCFGRKEAGCYWLACQCRKSQSIDECPTSKEPLTVLSQKRVTHYIRYKHIFYYFSRQRRPTAVF